MVMIITAMPSPIDILIIKIGSAFSTGCTIDKTGMSIAIAQSQIRQQRLKYNCFFNLSLINNSLGSPLIGITFKNI